MPIWPSVLLRAQLSGTATRLLRCVRPARSALGYSRAVVCPSAMAGGATTAAPLPAALEGLEPAALWRHFARLSELPRPSKHEGKVLDWLKAWADERQLAWQQDAAGNLVIRRPGSGGGEAAAPVILQGHVDMVTEKNAGTAHDFMADPLTLLRDGDWVTADGTTLGADNGIGVCCILAALELPPSAKLPPLEALFTVDEETGLTGAFQLDPSLLSGKTMVNLDTEEWGEVYIGCAGGGDSVLTLAAEGEALGGGSTSWVGLEVHVGGLLGGHSGINIHEGRGNAVRLGAALADAALAAAPSARLAYISGGDKRNAIARECRLEVAAPAEDAAAVTAAVERRGRELVAEFGGLEAGLAVTVAAAGAPPPAALAPPAAERLLTLLLALPHGALKMSHAVEGLVETSSNLASVHPQPEGPPAAPGAAVQYRLQCSTRSALGPALAEVRRSIARLGALCGAGVEQEEAYPGWAPQPDAEVVRIARRAIGQITGREPAVRAIHAGLECGIIGERLGGVESVSFGPTITGAHSPDERVLATTVPPFWEATLLLLGMLADRPAAAAVK